MLATLVVALLLTTLTTSVNAHGLIKVPPARKIGPAMQAACGAAPYNTLASDPYGPIETAADRLGSDATKDCDLYFCKGYKYADNNFYYKYIPGQVVHFETDIEAHHPGYVNVSILSTTTKKVISGPLIAWDPWGNWTDITQHVFDVTIPDLRPNCAAPDQCVLQWYWYSPRGAPYNGNNQTYESCIDFTLS